MLHAGKENKEGYLLQGLDDGVGILEGLGLATEVTGDGLNAVVSIILICERYWVMLTLPSASTLKMACSMLLA